MSFQQGLSGLNVSSKSLDVIGNNIANANTYGAKSSRAEFSDVYAASLNGAGVSNVGIGVRLATVAQQFTQGNITTTDNSMDLAINGRGYFQLSDGGEGTTYSRNGQFKVDKEGYIVNNDGLKLLGHPPASAAGGTAKASALQLPTGGIAPSATKKIGMEFNLNAGSAKTDPGSSVTPRINFSDATTYNNSTSITVYDGAGQPVSLSYYFQKGDTVAATDPVTGAPTTKTNWNVYVTANGATCYGTAANPTPYGTISFPPNGAAPDVSGLPALKVPASTNSAGAATLEIKSIAVDMSQATQYGSSFGVTDLTQDGYAAGKMTSIAIDSSGVIMARYSNGQSMAAGQLELVTFRNDQGLQPIGGNGWQMTFASGGPTPGAPGEGNMGVVQAGALEESNVDLTGELVNMITAQRNYQANAQTIKTMDQVMQTLVNLR